MQLSPAVQSSRIRKLTEAQAVSRMHSNDARRKKGSDTDLSRKLRRAAHLFGAHAVVVGARAVGHDEQQRGVVVRVAPVADHVVHVPLPRLHTHVALSVGCTENMQRSTELWRHPEMQRLCSANLRSALA